MSEKRFSGKWAGQYTYGKGYSERMKGVSVPFTLVMRIESGLIKGQCVDEGYADFDNPAVIEGTAQGQYISFVKKYPYYWGSQADGSIKYDKDRAAAEVHYSGEFRNSVFAGEWKIFSTYIREGGKMQEVVVSGYWIMHKEL